MKKLSDYTPEELFSSRTEIADNLVQQLHDLAIKVKVNHPYLFDKDVYGKDFHKLVEDTLVFLHDYRQGEFLTSENLIKILKKVDVVDTYTKIRELCSNEAKKLLNTWKKLKSHPELWKEIYIGHNYAAYLLLSKLYNDIPENDCILDELTESK